MTILGISIGTTRTGVCVLQDGQLLDRSVHNYTRPWSDNKLRIIINRYKRYVVRRKPAAIIVKVPPLKKHTKPIALIIKRLEMLAKDYDCMFDLITKRELKHLLMLRSTSSLIEYARLLHPELTAMYEKGTHNDHSYYKKLYEAILAAHVFEKRQGARAIQLAATTE